MVNDEILGQIDDHLNGTVWKDAFAPMRNLVALGVPESLNKRRERRGWDALQIEHGESPPLTCNTIGCYLFEPADRFPTRCTNKMALSLDDPRDNWCASQQSDRAPTQRHCAQKHEASLGDGGQRRCQERILQPAHK